jgi:hypothetical protein
VERIMKFFPLSWTLHAMRHISQEQVLNASREQLAEFCEQTLRLFILWEKALNAAIEEERARSRPLQ